MQPEPDRTSAFRSIVDLLLALVLTVVAGVMAIAVARSLAATGEVSLITVLLIQGGAIVLGVWLLLRWRGETVRHVGLRRPGVRDLVRAVLALLLVFAVNAVIMVLAVQLVPELAERHQEGLSGVADWLAGDMAPWTLLAITLFIGFYEEVLARGFILDRCRRLLPGIWAPVLASSLLFGLGHAYQGWFGVLQTAVVGVVFARLVVRWGTLWPVILAHAGLNFISLSVLRLI